MVDTLDTLVLLGNISEFRRAVRLTIDNVEFNLDKNVSVFETNIRILGGLLSAHLLAVEHLSAKPPDVRDKMNMGKAPSVVNNNNSSNNDNSNNSSSINNDDELWVYNNELLAMAIDVAERLLPAFDTPTGLPYGTVNLRHGVPPAESKLTSLAGAGSHLIEFTALSRLTGQSKYERTARAAMRAIWGRRSAIGLVGNHINIW